MKTKLIFLNLLRALGLFSVARRLTPNGLRILCYHGLSVADEHEFWPGTFMRPQTFGRRLSLLKEKGYPVLGFEEALQMMGAQTLPRNAVVITIDDGWLTTYSHMLPKLKQFCFPALLYASTYYIKHRQPVFNAAVAYLVWKSNATEIDVSVIVNGLTGVFDLTSPCQVEALRQVLVDQGGGIDAAPDRTIFLSKLAGCLRVDAKPIIEGEMLHFMNYSQLAELTKIGIAVELHTHRHRFGQLDKNAALAEIEDNRDELSKHLGGTFTHFCYPSGNYTAEQFHWLAEVGVETATTCEPGFNYDHTNLYELNRILDSEALSEIEFEAELCGLNEFLRRAKRMISRG